MAKGLSTTHIVLISIICILAVLLVVMSLSIHYRSQSSMQDELDREVVSRFRQLNMNIDLNTRPQPHLHRKFQRESEESIQ